jgi:hypothetical protein
LCWELCRHDTLPNEIAEVIGQLPALKALTCKHLHVAAGQHLPASLRELSVGVLCERDLEGVGQQFDLGRLTDLASLHPRSRTPYLGWFQEKMYRRGVHAVVKGRLTG